jgi:hypothetical protein
MYYELHKEAKSDSFSKKEAYNFLVPFNSSLARDWCAALSYSHKNTALTRDIQTQKWPRTVCHQNSVDRLVGSHFLGI